MSLCSASEPAQDSPAERNPNGNRYSPLPLPLARHLRNGEGWGRDALSFDMACLARHLLQKPAHAAVIELMRAPRPSLSSGLKVRATSGSVDVRGVSSPWG